MKLRPVTGGPFPRGKVMVGLTGTPASGKSAVSARLAELGALVLCADTMAKAELEPGGAGWLFAEKHCPAAFVNGRVDRRKLADAVFADDVLRRGLERAVHPAVISRAAVLAERAKQRVVVFDAPLLFESGMASGWFNLVITVSAPAETRLARAVARGWSPNEFARRSAVQLNGEKKNSLADFVLVNDGTLDRLRAEVDGLYKELSETRN